MTRAVFGAAAALGVFMLVGISTAVGQDDAVYSGPLFGTLGVEGSDFTAGSTIVLLGDGFRPSAPVQYTVRANASGVVAAAGESAADDSGAVRIEVTLTDAFGAGTYTATVSGISIDGATVELSSGLAVETLPEPTPEPRSAVVPTPVSRPTASPAPTPTTVSVSGASPTATPLPSFDALEQPAAGGVGDTAAPGGDEEPDGQEPSTQGATPSGAEPQPDKAEAAESEQAAVQVPGAETGSSGWGLGRWLAAFGALVVIAGAAFALRASGSAAGQE